MTFQDFKQKLVDAVSKELGIDSDLEIIQADPKFADLAIPLHKYKVDKLDIKLEGIESSEVVGGFFNIRLNSRFLAEMLLDSGEDFGKSDIFKGQQVVF